MSIDSSTSVIAELQAVIERMRVGIRDPEAARTTGEEMARMREETRKRIGTVEVAVDLIREARDE